MATFDDQGRQLPDPRPVEWPTELKRPLSMADEIKRYVRLELSRRAEAVGVETFEDADDFEVDDDDLVLSSPYELEEEQIGKDASDLAKPEPPPPAKQPEGPSAPVVAPSGPGVSTPAPKSEP